LKDASASAIYGSRGCKRRYPGYNQKRGIGPAKIDVGAFVGLSGVMRKTKVLDAGQYRAALKSYNARRLIPVQVLIHSNLSSRVTQLPKITLLLLAEAQIMANIALLFSFRSNRDYTKKRPV